MTLYRAVVEVLIEAENETDAMDGVAAMLRPLLQSGHMLDWQYAADPEILPEQKVQKIKLYGKPTAISPDAAEVHFDEFTAK